MLKDTDMFVDVSEQLPCSPIAHPGQTFIKRIKPSRELTLVQLAVFVGPGCHCKICGSKIRKLMYKHLNNQCCVGDRCSGVFCSHTIVC